MSTPLKTVDVALLSSFGNCFLIEVIREMGALGIQPKAVILDGAQSAASKKIVESRLLPTYPFVSLTEMDLPNIPFYFVQDHNSASTLKLIQNLKVSYLANAGTPRILKTPILNSVKGVLNCHPGILPSYRGCTCVEWSIFNGDPVGASSHLMTPGIDDGPLLKSQILVVKPFESYEQVRTKMMTHQAKLLVVSLIYMIKNSYSLDNPPPQPVKSESNYYKPIPQDKLQTVVTKMLSGHYQSSE